MLKALQRGIVAWFDGRRRPLDVSAHLPVAPYIFVYRTGPQKPTMFATPAGCPCARRSNFPLLCSAAITVAFASAAALGDFRMRGLGKISTHLNAMRRNLAAANFNEGTDGRLVPMANFGSNPGRLDCRIYVPTTEPRGLVVILHGCTQGASSYDEGSGWSQLAERHGFAVMFPQQRRANNPNLCFNWYEPNHARRSQGEASSISQMVKTMTQRYGLNRSRVFVTGLSAGGAMTAVMLACYPELFAGGAIIAGLPYATANTLPEALERMRGQRIPGRAELAALMAGATTFDGPTPTISVWHGTHDNIVDPANADAIVNQWRGLHGLSDSEGRVDEVSGHLRQIWADSSGRPLIEKYSIRGMGHGTPLSFGGQEACGRPGPHMLETSICSTRQMAQSWGLMSHEIELSALPSASRAFSVESSPQQHQQHPNRIAVVIEDALRSAGLMR
jgi:poly(hydroxyalkanoate) depolymerase family esterase